MHTLYLPGATGAAEFWQPMAGLLPGPSTLLSWPGLGKQPPTPDINGVDDLVALTESKIEGPKRLVAQSIGGVVAMQVALRQPQLIQHLVLCASPGGIDVSDVPVLDWRPQFKVDFPQSASWLYEDWPDLSASLKTLKVPTTVLYGDSDPITPVEIGQRLVDHLPQATMHVIPGGDHDFARTHADQVARIILAASDSPQE